MEGKALYGALRTKRDPEGLSSQDKSKAQSWTHPLPSNYIQNKPKYIGAPLLLETRAGSQLLLAEVKLPFTL